jgi:uncharacterized protein
LICDGTGLVLLLNGWADTIMEVPCSRCGKLFSQPVHAVIQEDFVVTPPQLHGQALRVEEEEAPESRVFIGSSLDLNLDEFLRQNILVALPMQLLCEKDCPGLCTRCGKRQTAGPCKCARDDVNPQFAELQRLLEESSQAE